MQTKLEVTRTHAVTTHTGDNDTAVPEISTTVHSIMQLLYQYFTIYAMLALVRTALSFKSEVQGLCSILEACCTTLTYAPMLCILFLGIRLRAIQLTNGDTVSNDLPQEFVQKAMKSCVWAVQIQVSLVGLIGFATGLKKVETDKEGHVDVSALQNNYPVIVNVLTLVRWAVMAMLYGGAAVVVYGGVTMEAPQGTETPNVSPALQCTIILTTVFFVIYLIVALSNTFFEVLPALRSSNALLKLEAAASAAKMTVNFAPMLAILFIGARMRAYEIGMEPQSWAQKCFYMSTISVLIQSILALLLPFVVNAQCSRGACEGDVRFEIQSNKAAAAVMTFVRYGCLFALYIGVIGVVYSILTIQDKDGKAPPLSPAMECIISLATQYFLVYTMVFFCITVRNYVHNDAVQGVLTRAIFIFDSARATVMIAPMLSVLFMGCRMRALQMVGKDDGSAPAGSGPQLWAQESMQIATTAVFVQLVMCMMVPVLTGEDKPEMDSDGFVKAHVNHNKCFAVLVELIRYAGMICLYVGAVLICVAIHLMTPETVQPNETKGLRALLGV
jgi:hypothetical protein